MHVRVAERAEADRDAPRFSPSVSLVGAGLLNGPEITFPRGASGEEATVVPWSRARFEITAETPLFRFSASGAARRARAAVSAADLGMAQALSDLRRDVKRAYYSLSSAEAGLAIAREGMEQAQAHRRLVDDLMQAGQAARIDQLQADVQVEEAATAGADAAEGRELAAARLLQVLGAAHPMTSAAVDGTVPAGEGSLQREQLTRLRELTPEGLRLLPPDEEPGPEPDGAAARASIERRPDVRALAAQVEAAEAGARLARAQAAPSIDLAVGYALQTPSAFVARSSWRAGLTLTVPLGMRHRVAAEAREAAARAEAARAALTELKQGAQLEVLQSLHAMRAARRRRASAARAAAAAEEALRIAELQFQRGLATSLELNAAGATLQRHRLDALRALYDWHTAAADLERATGVPVDGSEAQP